MLVVADNDDHIGPPSGNGVAKLADGQALPLEFTILRYHPRAWKVADSLLVQANMVQVLTNRGLQQDITYEKMLEKLGPELTAQLYPRTSPRDRIPGAEARADGTPAAANAAHYARIVEELDYRHEATQQIFSVFRIFAGTSSSSVRSI